MPVRIVRAHRICGDHDRQQGASNEAERQLKIAFARCDRIERCRRQFSPKRRDALPHGRVAEAKHPGDLAAIMSRERQSRHLAQRWPQRRDRRMIAPGTRR